MKNVVIPANLGATIKAHALAANKYDINLDGTSLVADPATGEVSVDTAALSITVVSADAGQVLTAGTDGGAFFDKETFEDLVGDMVVSATDGLTYDDAIGALTAAVASATGADTDNISTTASLDAAGVLTISSTITLDPSVDNLLKSSAAGLMLDKADVAAAAAAGTTNVHAVVSDTTFGTTVNGVATTSPIEELQDAFGVHLGEMFQ